VTELKDRITELLSNETNLREEISSLQDENNKLKSETNRSTRLYETKVKSDCLEHASLNLKIDSLQNDIEYHKKEIKVRDDLIEYI
jgi:hypothetical protein